MQIHFSGMFMRDPLIACGTAYEELIAFIAAAGEARTNSRRCSTESPRDELTPLEVGSMRSFELSLHALEFFSQHCIQFVASALEGAAQL